MEWPLRITLSVIFALVLVGRSIAKGSLSPSGGAAAFIVGTLTFAAGLRFTMVLLTFFITCSILTKKGKVRKQKVEEDYASSSCRNWEQVLCNGLTGTVACGILVALDWLDIPLPAYLLSALNGICLGHYACCIADTWASELGILSTAPPFHILTLRRVPAGTNGGVSMLGLGASVAGAAALGLSHWLTYLITKPLAHSNAALIWQALVPEKLASVGVAWESWWSVLLVAALGLVGSLLDSVLGAVLQYSGSVPGTERVVNGPRPGAQHICGRDLVSNNTVNLLSSLITAALGGALGYWLS